MNILFMIEVKILKLMKWSYRCLPPSIMLIIEPRRLINWACSIILLKHTSLWCPFFDPHVYPHHSNIVIGSNKLTMKSLHTLECLTLGCEFYKRISFHKIGSSWSMWALVCDHWYRQPKRTLSWHWKSKRRMQMLCCGLLAFIFITIFPKPVSEGTPAILTSSFTLPTKTALWTVLNLITLLLSSITLPELTFSTFYIVIFRVKVSGFLTVSLLLQWSGMCLFHGLSICQWKLNAGCISAPETRKATALQTRLSCFLLCTSPRKLRKKEILKGVVPITSVVHGALLGDDDAMDDQYVS
jgi:hypothetical protein